MEQTMNKNKKKYTVIICVCMLAVIIVVGVIALITGRIPEDGNLARMKGVIAACDSTETEELSAYKAIDGNDEDLSSRWSSENNWEDASHYIELEFPEEISVSFVVLKWERRNAVSYALEGSMDGASWETLRLFDTAPEMRNQEIVLDEPVNVRFLRLSVYAVSDNEEDYSNLYQNVSLYEFEVYADKPAAYRLSEASIGYNEDGSRYLVMPEAPEGYEVTYLGADYEQVIGADGTVYDTIQDKEVTIGFRVSNSREDSDVREISQILTVPSYESAGRGIAETEVEVDFAKEQEMRYNDCPEVIPALAEWRGGQGSFEMGGSFRIIVEEGSTLKETAELFKERYNTTFRCIAKVVSGSLEDAEPGDIFLGYADASEGLGEEGYFCDISDICVIRAETDIGVRWGTVTILQILSGKGSLPCGQIRDYPLYQVRGFGIDVARKPVSMETLYAMMETMSYYKMNDLAVHLNDNSILSTSGLADTVEHAMTADSAFRLESDIANESGQRLTSEEYAYTKEEFDQFIEIAKTYGVTVVPEIDTPAHSLSITKMYPEYALTGRAESVDQIDLDNADAVELVKTIWQEALEGDDAALRNARIVNIGMDEYYGDGEQYRVYASEIADLVRASEKTVRMWGSLSNMSGKTMPDTEGLQMNIWSTLWADPRQMYEAGYSLINMENIHLYVIPGGGFDYLDKEELYMNWEPNKFYDYNEIEIIPSYSPQMLGAAYMIWNDMSGTLDIGISEYDLYERFEQPLVVLSAKLWGMKELPYEEFCEVADIVARLTFDIKGEKNRLYDEKIGLEPDYEVQMRVWLEHGMTMDEEQTEPPNGQADGQMAVEKEPQIIAESDSAYGEWAFYAVEPETGCVGFSREGRTYTWEYTLPYDEWVELKVLGELGQTTLYVNGDKIDTLGNGEPFEEYATFVFPVQRIGEETGVFRGEVSLEWHRPGNGEDRSAYLLR
ncbi:MAG: family 20 glycosylhydrolase [Lachnospiraceae bacterium]|nr:family 20 glycosylhydrolase [Lachnospiraceae bacterium]